MIKKQKKTVAKPKVEPAPISSEQFPSGLECLAGGNPLDAIQAMFPDAKSDFKSLAPLMSIFGLDPGFPVPQWATNAAHLGFKMMGFEINGMDEGCASPALGKMIGFVEAAPPIKDERLKSDEATKIINNACQTAKDEAAKSTPEKSDKFFSARLKGASEAAQIRFIRQRAKAFLFVSIMWQVIPELKSAAELHRLLVDVNALSANTDAAETRKICRIIGLPLKGKAGRRAKK